MPGPHCGATLLRMEPDDLEDVIAQLRDRRAAVVARLQRIDAALEALGRPVAPAQERAVVSVARAEKRGPSVYERVLRLLEEGDRAWSVADIIDTCARRGEPLVGSSVSNNVRSALAKLHQTGRIVRVEQGRYKSARFMTNGHSLHEQEVVPHPKM